jgi:phosphatidylethanolamine/phosphatidyl-N-methylethanolamine N-methyltransferase
MELEAIKKAYRRYARLYDLYFGAVFQPGRRAVVERMRCRSGERVLEVGVGTGMSLPLYPKGVHVTGIDISPEMLQRARVRLARERIREGIDLHVMDAERMSFPSDAFDKVVAMYVVSVVPHPQRLVDEMRRVCKPTGEIFIVNHFHSPNPIVGSVESLLAPLSRLVGFHPDFCLETFVRDTHLDVIDKQRVNLFGYWNLLRARNNKQNLTPLSLDATA